MDAAARFLDFFNFTLPGGRWQLFEWCDLWFIPPFIKYACQETLTAQWTKRLPILQSQPPALLAAQVIAAILDDVERKSSSPSSWTVIDFCSGAGGPVPSIESYINADRVRKGKSPIPFRLSDLYPNLDAWMIHSSRSKNLSFIPQSVDATDPPLSAVSTTEDSLLLEKANFSSNDSKAGLLNKPIRKRKVLRLFNLSFHHFSDPSARKVLASTLKSSDAFAIVELQDRNIFTLAFMTLEFWLLFSSRQSGFGTTGLISSLPICYRYCPWSKSLMGW